MDALDTLVLDHQIEYPATLPPPPTGPPIPHHAWEYLDPVTACDWFWQHTLDVPTAGTVHFSRDARYHDLELTRKSVADFGSVTFNVPPSGTVQFVEISNVFRVRIDAARSQLSTQGGLVFDVGRDTHPNYQGRPVLVEITNLGFTPNTVVQWNLSPGDAPPLFAMTPAGVFRFISQATGTTVDTIELRP